VTAKAVVATALVAAALAGCKAKEAGMGMTELSDFAARYTAAWSSGDPQSVAGFFAENGTLRINDGEPSVGRQAIAATARSFMTALPDMVLTMDGVAREGARVIYRWTLDGTNTGPGGTGNRVHISGHEEWTVGPDGLIVASLGHMDEAEYRRQLAEGP
jgi:uncharacterized protein (TIGR02246 family)